MFVLSKQSLEGNVYSHTQCVDEGYNVLCLSKSEDDGECKTLPSIEPMVGISDLEFLHILYFWLFYPIPGKIPPLLFLQGFTYLDEVHHDCTNLESQYIIINLYRENNTSDS